MYSRMGDPDGTDNCRIMRGSITTGNNNYSVIGNIQVEIPDFVEIF
jgi:hypothetical protein